MKIEDLEAIPLEIPLSRPKKMARSAGQKVWVVNSGSILEGFFK